MKRVVLCADDFGQGDGVDAGILRLIEARRLTAVSCLATGRRLEQDAAALLAHGDAVDVGLHLDLTGGHGLSGRFQLGALLLQAFAGALDRRAVERRLLDQLLAFERVAGRAPAFVDGHEHVHQLPGVREVLLRVLAERYGRSPPAVRSTVPRRARGLKARVVAALGGRGLERELVRRGLPHNGDFAGLYGLRGDGRYPARMRAWLRDVADGGLVLCHPGLPGSDPASSPAARVEELEYLASPAFERDLAGAGVVLVRFAQVLGS